MPATRRRATSRPRIRGRALGASLAGSLAAGLVLTAGAAYADDAASISDVQTQLAGCAGTIDMPTIITLTADVNALTTSLTVPCVTRLVLAGHTLHIASLTVSSGDILFVGDPTVFGDGGTLTADGAGSASGFDLTSSRMEVDTGTVTASKIAADDDGRLDVAGGTVTAGSTTGIGTSGVSLGDGGVISVTVGGSLTGIAGPKSVGGVVTGDDGTILVAGGTLTGTGTSGAMGVGVGDDGIVVVVSGVLNATGGSNQPGLEIPATGRATLSGGTVQATGGSSGAGIGSGSAGAAGEVEVAGGDVTATGGSNADGVGAGKGGTSGPLVMDGGTLTASAPSTGSAIGIDATSGPVKIEGGTLRLPSGTMTIPDVFSGSPELAIGPAGVLDGSVVSGSSQTYATYSGTGQLSNSGTVRVPVNVVTANGVQLDGNYFQVGFNTQGGAPSAIDPATVTATSFSTASLNFPANPTLSGHTFTGWNTAPDGSGTPITATSPLPGASADGSPVKVTAYAVFTYIPPVLRSVVASPKPRHAGWYTTPIRITYTCVIGTLALSGSCPSPVVLATEGRLQRVSRSITDNGGTTVFNVVDHIAIDLTRPRVRPTGITPGATYPSARKVGCRVTDGLSGAAGCKVFVKVKPHSVIYKLIGRDVAGNVRTVIGSYKLR